MSRDTGDPPLNAQTARDMEAHSGEKASPNVTGRLWTRLRTIAQTRVEGPVEEAVEAGATLFSYDPTTFLADFHATKSRQMARPDRMFEVVIRAPGKDCILACMDSLPNNRLHAHGQLISRAVDEDVFRRPDKHSMYEWLSLLRSRLLVVPTDAVVALSDHSLPTGLLSSIDRLQLFHRRKPQSASVGSIKYFKPLTTAWAQTRSDPKRSHDLHDVKLSWMECPSKSGQINRQSQRSRTLPYASSITINEKYARDHMTRNKELLDEVQQKFKSIFPIDGESQEARLLEELVGKVKEDLEYVEEELAKIGNSIEELRKE
ncbi:MAG: hypothetical protein L6R42_005946, partial [Xanthoria sp. 1 TBL-2021]